MYTITGWRETAGNRGLTSFLIEIDADSPEEALAKCAEAFGTYDVASGTAVFTPAQFADVQVTPDDPDQVQPFLEVPLAEEAVTPTANEAEAVVVSVPVQQVTVTEDLEPVGVDTDGQIKPINELSQGVASDSNG